MIIQTCCSQVFDQGAARNEENFEIEDCKWYWFPEGDPNQKFIALKSSDNKIRTASVSASGIIARLSAGEAKRKMLSTESKVSLLRGRYQGLRTWIMDGDDLVMQK